MKFDVALGTSLVVIAFDGQKLVTLVGKRQRNLIEVHLCCLVIGLMPRKVWKM